MHSSSVCLGWTPTVSQILANATSAFLLVSASLSFPTFASGRDARHSGARQLSRTLEDGARSLAGTYPRADAKPLVAAGLILVRSSLTYLSTTRDCNLWLGPFELTGKYERIKAERAFPACT